MARILLLGQAAFGRDVLAGLLAAGHEISAVSLPPDREGRALDPLKEATLAAGLDTVQRRSYRDADAAAALRADTVDIAVLAFVTQIIPVEVLDAPRLASLCFHPSLLPAYRGGSAINWQIIRGETRGGLALFRPDAGLDAGPVYLEKELVIGPDDTAGSYYYSTVFETGVAATLESVELLLAGEAVPGVQDESLASYDPLCRDEHAGVDFDRPRDGLHDLVRGCDPSPGAHCLWRGETLRLYGSRKVEAESAAAATVLTIDDEGMTVACADGALRFARLGTASVRKAAAAELADGLGLVVGAQLEAA